MFNSDLLNQLKYQTNHYLPLPDYCILRLSGDDCTQFLQGQTTQNISLLESGKVVINTRLERTGTVSAYFFMMKDEDSYFLVVPKTFNPSLKIDFEKYIVMEDVEIELLDKKIYFTLDPSLFENKSCKKFQGEIFGEEGVMFWDVKEVDLTGLKKYDQNNMNVLFKLNGYLEILGDFKVSLINDSILNLSAIAYDKGCFLGSESVAKIQNGRGSSFFPTLLLLKEDEEVIFENNENFFINDKKSGIILDRLLFDERELLLVNLFRNHRVEGANLSMKIRSGSFQCEVIYYPFFSDSSWKKKSDILYDKGMVDFVENREDSSIINLKNAIRYNSKNSDACEALGVIYGRHEKYVEAIELMDKLLVSDPSSVMAHSNKSLYLMKLGKIDEAEEEKSKATVKSFAKFGEEAEIKERQETAKKQEANEQLKRREMFLQVLEIDAEDAIANQGMADFLYKENKYIESLEYLDVVYKNNSKNTQVLKLLAFNYQALGDNELALRYYKQGIETASSKGEMKLANEMQARLIQLQK